MPKSLDTISKTKKEKAALEAKAEPVVETVPPETKSVKNKSTEVKIDGEPIGASEITAGDTIKAPKDETYESIFPEPTVAISTPPTWIWWLLLILGTIGLAFLGYGLANGRINQWLSTTATPTPGPQIRSTATPVPTATATSTATASPTPSATPTVTPTPSSAPNISISVLNGTTVNGAAASAKSTLEKAGFTVRSTGNAIHQNYTKTVIYYQTGELDQAKQVQAALPNYSSTLTESTSLAKPDDVLVVIGPKS